MATVHGQSDRSAHVQALMAQGMSERSARVAELCAFMAEAQRRREAFLAGNPAAAAEAAARRATYEERYAPRTSTVTVRVGGVEVSATAESREAALRELWRAAESQERTA